MDAVAPSVEDCIVEAEKEPGGLEVVPSQGDLGEGEALGTAGGECVAIIDWVVTMRKQHNHTIASS